jgi:DNA-binding beta-propeller fold protein YncE
MRLTRAPWAALAVLWISAASSPAHALVVSARENPAAEVDVVVEFTATAMGAGAITYTWDFGDGTRLGPLDSATIEHTFTAPGHYVIIVIAKDDSGVRSDSFVQTVHHPLSAQPPAASTTIAYDAARDRVCTVNPDHDSVSCLDGTTLISVFEASVGEHPRTLALDDDGALWVTNDDASSISVVDASGAPVAEIALPYGAHPFGIAKSPTDDVMFVAASGVGQLIAISTATRAITASVDVGPSATGVSVSGDGERILVTRFISSADHGEVTEVSANDLTVVRRFELAPGLGPDTEATSRGVPNYLRSVLVTPDGRSAWVLSKQDNTARGVARDGMPLTFETTTRTTLSVLDLEQNEERMAARVDINNRSLGLAGALSPVGDYLFVALLGTNGVDVVDTFDGNSVGGRRELGFAPDGIALSPSGRLYVHAFLSRAVFVLDASGVLSSTDFSLPYVLQAQTVQSEALPANVLQGKQIFYNAADTRMSRDGYIACATCHLDGFEDSRVWDFTDRGEGLRNTTSLLGKRGTGHGPLHWTANFDEVQDFEHDIRNAFGGTGFMTDDVFATGTRNQTLGDAKAGISAELDALAAYLESLDHVPASPHRDQDGTLTDDGWAGHALFETAGCRECHGGADFTDSAAGLRHDVGTLSATSGQRLGEALDGLDTPTLRGVWQTAPYLHDGSAATLLDAIASPDDAHGRTRALSEEQRDQLVSYLLQIDNTAYDDERELPPPPPDAGSGETDDAGIADAAMGAIDAASPPAGDAASESSGGCSTLGRSASVGSGVQTLFVLLLPLAYLMAGAQRRRRPDHAGRQH